MAEQLDRCVLCGDRDIRPDRFAKFVLNLAEQHGVSRCRACGLRFLNPRPTKDEYRQLYESNAGPLADVYSLAEEFYGEQVSLRIAEYRRKLRFLCRIGAVGRLLEIGACTGVFLNEARQSGFDVVGIEPNCENRRIARDRFDLDLLPGNVEDHDFESQSFDVVFSSHVFEHLRDPLTIARKAVGWLRPGGIHLMEVPNQFENPAMTAWRWRLRPARSQERSLLSVHHTVFFSPRTLRLLARRSGCRTAEVRNVHYTGFPSLHQPRRVLERGLSLFLGATAIELVAHKR